MPDTPAVPLLCRCAAHHSRHAICQPRPNSVCCVDTPGHCWAGCMLKPTSSQCLTHSCSWPMQLPWPCCVAQALHPQPRTPRTRVTQAGQVCIQVQIVLTPAAADLWRRAARGAQPRGRCIPANVHASLKPLPQPGAVCTSDHRPPNRRWFRFKIPARARGVRAGAKSERRGRTQIGSRRRRAAKTLSRPYRAGSTGPRGQSMGAHGALSIFLFQQTWGAVHQRWCVAGGEQWCSIQSIDARRGRRPGNGRGPGANTSAFLLGAAARAAPRRAML